MANHWIQKRGNYWVIVQRGSNRVLSRHRSRKLAEQSFRAMEASKHGAVMRNRKKGKR